MSRETANPVTAEFAEPLPKKKSTSAMRIVETLPSRIEGHARLKPVCIASCTVRPTCNSSLTRSKIRMFASTAMPSERMNPASPASVSVTGISLNTESTRMM